MLKKGDFTQFLSLSEAQVSFDNIADAMKETLKFVVTDGNWRFEEKTYGLSRMNTISVVGHLYCDKGHFFLSSHAFIAQNGLPKTIKSIDPYDSATGRINQDVSVNIIASLSLFNDKPFGPRLTKIAEASNTSERRLKSPYELAIWVKKQIDEYNKPFDNDDDDDDSDDNSPITPSLGKTPIAV